MEKDCVGSDVGCQLVNGFQPNGLHRDRVGQIGQSYSMTSVNLGDAGTGHWSLMHPSSPFGAFSVHFINAPVISLRS